MKNVLKEFKEHCLKTLVPFDEVRTVLSYDDTTLFCPAGMQQFSSLFEKKWIKGTCANSQPCLRVNDMEEMGDGSHLVYFNMLGLFSFREMTMKNAIDWWVSFIEERLGLVIDKVTIHPDRLRDWLPFVDEYLKVETDNDCTWTDDNVFGYCMEFYVGDVEVGNVVNTGGDCIDVGFGLERLNMVCNGTKYDFKTVLKDSINKIIESGVSPSPSKSGYILRKFLNLAVKEKIEIDHPYYLQEKKRISKMQEFYSDNKEKFKGRSKEWWEETHGIDFNIIENK